MSRRQDDRFTYSRQLIFEACGNSRCNAEVMNYLIGCFKLRHKKHPNDPLESEHFTFQYSSVRIAANTFYCRKTAERALSDLRRRGLIFIQKAENSLNRTNKIRINFARLELWRSQGEGLLPFPEFRTETPNAMEQNVPMERDIPAPSTETSRHHVYKHLNTACISSSSAAASEQTIPEEDKPVIARLVTEAGFTEPLAASCVAQHGRQLPELALAELGRRSCQPDEATRFVRGFIKKPGNFNATNTEHGWIIGRKEGKPQNESLLLAAVKELRRAREVGICEQFYLDYGMIPREYKVKALAMEKA